MKIHGYILAIVLALLPTQGFNAEVNPDLKFKVTPLKDDSYQIEATLNIDAPEALLWKILTEYEKTHEYVASIKSSKVIKSEGNKKTVELKCEGKFLWLLPIRIRLLLDIDESKGTNKINFVEVSKEEFHIFKGYWQVSKGEEGTHDVSIHLTTKPKDSYFGLVKRIIEYSVKGVMADLERKVKHDLRDQAAAKKEMKREEKMEEKPLPKKPAR